MMTGIPKLNQEIETGTKLPCRPRSDVGVFKRKNMRQNTAIDLIARQNWLERTAAATQPVINDIFKAGGAPGRKIKDFLHGAWFGHPLHPALTDVPLGA